MRKISSSVSDSMYDDNGGESRISLLRRSGGWLSHRRSRPAKDQNARCRMPKLGQKSHILATISLAHPAPFVVGFAAETQDVSVMRVVSSSLKSRFDCFVMTSHAQILALLVMTMPCRCSFSERYEREALTLEKKRIRLLEQLGIIGEAI